MENVTIQLLGGLGNNMFQIAAAHAYAVRNNKELILLNEKFGTTHGALDTYRDNILSKLRFVDRQYINQQQYSVFQEIGFEYNAIPNIPGNVALSGYFQSEKYFLDLKDSILNLFSYSNEHKENVLKKHSFLNNNSCSIHVRRGDYVSLSNIHPIQSITYYMKAVRQMPEESVFIIFSDDIDWCKNNFPNIPEKFIFIENISDHESLLMMSLCKNNILSNSSFSWWGAWLNQNKDKKVIVPSKWFGNSVNHDTKDLYCKDWIKI